MLNCLVGCEACQCGEIQKTVDAEIVAPIVTVKFTGGGGTIKMGNKSSPDNKNLAIIKSFEFGTSDGFMIKLEIIDQRGGAFTNFLQTISQCLTTRSQSFSEIEVQYGWLKRKCQGAMASPILSKPIKATVFDIKSECVGNINRFYITATDSMRYATIARYNNIFGGDKDKKISLREALDKLMDLEPKLKPIKLKRKSKGGEVEDWKFKSFGEKGPEDCWKCCNEDRITIIKRWLKPYLTDKDKGIVFTSDTQDPNQLIAWEDFQKEDGCEAGQSLGTFIVGLGSCGKVIDFRHEINWATSIGNSLQTGGAIVSNSSTPQRIYDQREAAQKAGNCQSQPAGYQATITVSDSDQNVLGKKAGEEINKAQQLHEQAGKVFRLNGVIKGTLVIQGDPDIKFQDSSMYLSQFLSIIVRNPFAISGNSNCEWLAAPPCNNVLTSKKWQVTAVNHSIRDGIFRTTLEVHLAAGGIDIPYNGEFQGGCG